MAEHLAHHGYLQVVQRRSGGFKEELREINFSIGAEYSYNQQFFLRAGYFNEKQIQG